FRSARLIIADMLRIDQRSELKRFAICIPLFIAGYAITQLPFGIVWRYFAWTNQTLATVVLWAVVVWLCQRHANRWVALIPAVLMTYVCTSFVFVSDQFFGMTDRATAYGLAFFATAAISLTLLISMRGDAKNRS
ncbi:MAG: carbon starvation protein A, partial [Alistipes sp.]|nr:carbon starvation protein A [Alistipes sp.]